MTIKSNKFINNSVELIFPQTSTSLKLNKQGLGGALYFDCKNEKAELFRNCTIQITDRN